MPIFVQLIQPDKMGMLCQDEGDEYLTDLKGHLEKGEGFMRFVLLEGGQSMLIPVANIAVVRYISKEDVEKNKKEAEKARKEAEVARREQRQSNIIKPNMVFPGGRGRSQ